MSRPRLLIIWLVLLGLAAVTTWLVISHQGSAPSPQASGPARALPDYSMTGALLTRYGMAGQPRYILHSDRITHQREEDVSLLSKVELDYYSPSRPYWHLSAQRGRLSDKGNHVVLIDRVRAHQPAATDTIHLRTSRLTLELRKQLISSDARATIVQGIRETQGTGLKADLERGTVKLLHDVTSRYEPHED